MQRVYIIHLISLLLRISCFSCLSCKSVTQNYCICWNTCHHLMEILSSCHPSWFLSDISCCRMLIVIRSLLKFLVTVAFCVLTDVCSISSCVVCFTEFLARCAKYCDLCVGLSVCLSTQIRISKTRRPNFAKVSSDVICGRGSVLLWRQRNILCASSFVDACTYRPTCHTSWRLMHSSTVCVV